MNELKYLDKVLVKDSFYGDWKGRVVDFNSIVYGYYNAYTIIQYTRFEIINFLLGGKMVVVIDKDVGNKLVKVDK
jgi:hypothetical protein